MKTNTLIERGDDGSFEIFTPDLESKILGEHITVAEASHIYLKNTEDFVWDNRLR